MSFFLLESESGGKGIEWQIIRQIFPLVGTRSVPNAPKLFARNPGHPNAIYSLKNSGTISRKAEFSPYQISGTNPPSEDRYFKCHCMLFRLFLNYTNLKKSSYIIVMWLIHIFLLLGLFSLFSRHSY